MKNERKVKNVFIEGPITSDFIALSIANHATKTGIGGHSIFLGQVRRDQVDNHFVAAINYTTYIELALPKIDEIRESLFQKYPLNCLHVYHSLGQIQAGEICLFVFTSSAHRKPAIDACNELVERIKKDVPIWGKEIFEDNTHQWKENI